jgi:hypothetical protein
MRAEKPFCMQLGKSTDFIMYLPIELPGTPEPSEHEHSEADQSETEQSEPDREVTFNPSERDVEIWASYNINSDGSNAEADDADAGSDAESEIDGFATAQPHDARVVLRGDHQQPRRRRRWNTRPRHRR